MEIEGWKYYNHAAIPTCAPHEVPDLTPIKDGSIWKLGDGKQKPLFARWSENWDCGYDTGWYYTIMDTPFDINALKAKRRYVIKQGIRNFDVRIINPREYVEKLFAITSSDIGTWPKKYRPSIPEKYFRMEMAQRWQDKIDKGELELYGAFHRETSIMRGYMLVQVTPLYKEMLMVMADPEYEKLQIKAAMINKLVQDSEYLISSGGYISNGSKNVSHETAFNEYLEKYFGFRKAFCMLKIKYYPLMRPIVNILYFFKVLLEKLDGIQIIHSINVIIKMEEVSKTENVGQVNR